MEKNKKKKIVLYPLVNAKLVRALKETAGMLSLLYSWFLCQ